MCVTSCCADASVDPTQVLDEEEEGLVPDIQVLSGGSEGEEDNQDALQAAMQVVHSLANTAGETLKMCQH